MQKQILAELKGLREVMTVLVGSSELPEGEQFSKTVLDKAAKEFKKLSTERNAWVEEYQLDRIFKGARYGSGKFLREELGFTQYFLKGRSHYYSRKALLALARELKERKVNLARYIEYRNEKANFEARLKKASGKKKLAAYQLPDDMHDIETSETPKPARHPITDELERLEVEFEELKMAEYINIYKTFAMLKADYHFAKFRDEAYRQRCKKWIENFNYANRALDMIRNS
ncbi:MAG TPA: hypothetical protein VGM63_25185 [Mucilaginibacter sp.]|jgi:glutaredoxin-related protein